jgi:DNA-binding XRE family transcriptional regulator
MPTRILLSLLLPVLARGPEQDLFHLRVPGILLLIRCRLIVFIRRNSKSMKDNALKRFGKRVRALRERTGLSQEALAAKAGIHRTYMGGVERGERNICLRNIIRLAEALAVHPGDLFGDTEQK